jgi:hypothetical protein
MSSRIDSINMPWATQAMKSRMLSAPESGARHCERLGGQLCWRCMYPDPFPWRYGRRAFRLHSNGLRMGLRRRRRILRRPGLRMKLRIGWTCRFLSAEDSVLNLYCAPDEDNFLQWMLRGVEAGLVNGIFAREVQASAKPVPC